MRFIWENFQHLIKLIPYMAFNLWRKFWDSMWLVFDMQIPGWQAGTSVYSGQRWMPPARPVGVWGGMTWEAVYSVTNSENVILKNFILHARTLSLTQEWCFSFWRAAWAASISWCCYARLDRLIDSGAASTYQYCHCLVDLRELAPGILKTFLILYADGYTCWE